jgi:hypothetical protein
VHGYVNWGGPEGATDRLDGTVVPCAPGGSLPFAPQECLTALRQMLAVGGERVWGRYGFVDAFNPQTGWVSTDVIAIDVGITLAMVENLRSGFCWKYFMRAPETRRAFALTGFESESPRHPFSSPVFAKAVREIGLVQTVPAHLDVALVKANPLRVSVCDRWPVPSRRGPFEGPNPVLACLPNLGTEFRLRANGGHGRALARLKKIRQS